MKIAVQRKKYHFSEYDLHEYAKLARVSWITDHVDSTMAQTLATRAYQAANRVCVGKAKRVRFRSQGRGIDSVEGKRNDVGMRFVLDPNAGDGGFLIWKKEVIPAFIDWRDPVVQHGMRHKMKYVRLVRRSVSSPQAQGADHYGHRYYVQLVLEGHAAVKPKHEQTGSDTVGLDIGPSSATRSRAQNCFMRPKRGSEAYCSTSSTLERRSGEATSRSRSPLTTFLSHPTAQKTVRQ